MQKMIVQNLQRLKSMILSATLRMLYLREESEEQLLYSYLARKMMKWFPVNQVTGGKQTRNEVELITQRY